MQVLRKKRLGTSVISIAIELIIFASVGLVALVLLATSSTAGLNTTVAFLAVTFVSLIAIIAVAVSFLRKGGLADGI